MLQILLGLSLFCLANVDEFLLAKTPEQIWRSHQLQGEEIILKERCQAEVQGQYFPANCLRWIKIVKLLPRERIFFEKWLDSICVKSLERDASQVQYHMKMVQELKAGCLQIFTQATDRWLYKAKKEGGHELFDKMNIGKEIEIVLSYEAMETKKLNRN